MLNYIKSRLIIGLLLILSLDLIALYITTTTVTSMDDDLKSRLNHEIYLIDQIHYEKNEFILFQDLATNQLDIAIYEPNAILFWRYNLSNMISAPKGAQVNRCQMYQSSNYLLLWGVNEDLQASTLKLTFNDQTYLEDLSQDLYFIKVYPLNGRSLEKINCSFYNDDDHDISSYFFESFN